MTNQQLYLAIGVPILFNTVLIGFMWHFMWQHINTRFDALEKVMDAVLRLSMLDARLKHLEEKP